MDERKYSLKELKDVVELLGIGAKHDTSSTTPSFVPLHGPIPGSTTQYGALSSPGVRPGLWNATPRVRSIGQFIPMFPSVNANELIDVATGVTVGSGNNQTSACVVGPKPGQLKKMKISATFGIIHESTKIFDVTQAGMRRNRADVDRELFNNAAINNPWLPQVPGIEGDGFVNSALRTELMALGVDLERNVGQVHFVGVSGTEDNIYRGVARQWNGLDRLIRNDWTDVDTGLSVPMANAAVISFNAAIDGGMDANSRTIVAALIDTLYSQIDFLMSISVNPVFALVMRPELFRALAAVWSCSFATTRCTSDAAGAPVVRDAEATRRLYEDILRQQYLPMEGRDIPVILDDTIPRQTLGNNYYKSDLYGVALSGNGRPVLYGEFFDMNNPEAMEIVNFAGGGMETTTVNNGMYRVFKRVTGGCYEFDFFARPRLITDAPFMHFRVDDLFYYSFTDRHTPIPGFSGYVNGGLTYAS